MRELIDTGNKLVDFSVYHITLDKVENQAIMIRGLINQLIDTGGYKVISTTKKPFVPIENPEKYEINAGNTLTKATTKIKGPLHTFDIEYDDPPVLNKQIEFKPKQSSQTSSSLSNKTINYSSVIKIRSGSTPPNHEDLHGISKHFLDDIFNDLDFLRKWVSVDFESTDFNKYKKEQYDFLETLTSDEKRLLKTYTYQGDRVINDILRNNVSQTQPTRIVHNITKLDPNIKEYSRRGGEVETTVPTPSEIKQKAPVDIVGTLPLYINKFLNVFKKVPVLKTPLKVYRGIKADEVTEIHGNQFLSTSYDMHAINSFRGEDCCTLFITLQPGVRALFIHALSPYKHEKEILVGPPFKATIKKTTYEGFEAEGQYDVTISPVSRGGITYKRKRKTRLTRRKKLKFKQ